MPSFDSSGVLAGLTLGTASILSIGPNNVLLVREGLVRGRIGTVATFVWTSNFVFLLAAFALTNVLSATSSPVRAIFAWLGLAWICWFAFAALRTAFRAGLNDPGKGREPETMIACFKRVMSVVWLNPLTYIEFLLIPAAICGRFESASLRVQFFASLAVVAAVGCYGYPLGGSACATVLQHRRALQVFDLSSGCLLIAVAAVMAVRLCAGIG